MKRLSLPFAKRPGGKKKRGEVHQLRLTTACRFKLICTPRWCQTLVMNIVSEILNRCNGQRKVRVKACCERQDQQQRKLHSLMVCLILANRTVKGPWRMSRKPLQCLPHHRRIIKIVLSWCLSWLSCLSLHQLLRNSVDSLSSTLAEGAQYLPSGPVSRAQLPLTGALWHVCSHTDILSWFRHELQYQHLLSYHRHCGRQDGKDIG